jgi:hypothetical protein
MKGRNTMKDRTKSALRQSTLVAIASYLLVVIVAAGCASARVSNQKQVGLGGKLPRPARVWVHDFAATAADVPSDSPLAGKPTGNLTDKEIALGRELGTQIATELAAQISAMGLPAARPAAGTVPRINDLVIRGTLLSINPGSTLERVTIGCGLGASELRTAVETYQVTAEGPRMIESETIDAGGSKGPGAALGVVGLAATGNPAGLIVSTGLKLYGEESGRSRITGRAKSTAAEIAGLLQQRFQRQGWVQ